MMFKMEISGRIKVTYSPKLRILSVKDKKKEIKFKAIFWTDGNITMKYKRKDSLHWFDLGFRGNVYSMDHLKLEIKRLIEKIEDK